MSSFFDPASILKRKTSSAPMCVPPQQSMAGPVRPELRAMTYAEASEHLQPNQSRKPASGAAGQGNANAAKPAASGKDPASEATKLEGIRDRNLRLLAHVLQGFSSSYQDELAYKSGTLFARKAPEASRWNNVFTLLTKANHLLAAGKIPEGLRALQKGIEFGQGFRKEFSDYLGHRADNLATAEAVATVVRDIAIAELAILTAPAVAAIAAPVLGTAGGAIAGTLAAGTAAGAVQAGGTVLGELVSDGKVDWKKVAAGGAEGFRKGLIEGGFALLGASPSVNKLAHLSPGAIAKTSKSWLLRAAELALKEGAKAEVIGTLRALVEEVDAWAFDPAAKERWKADPGAEFAAAQQRFGTKILTSLAGGMMSGAVDANAPRRSRLGKWAVNHRGDRLRADPGLFTHFKTKASSVLSELPGNYAESVAEALADLAASAYAENRPVRAREITEALAAAGVTSVSKATTGQLVARLNDNAAIVAKRSKKR
ncbi:MAG: hypothetical protein EP329_25835 [Deltaproteobacteria bacterium]|nr:MAG: hypothetical protein EP329_25835 [Deltaproteobacteria bacterium]